VRVRVLQKLDAHTFSPRYPPSGPHFYILPNNLSSVNSEQRVFPDSRGFLTSKKANAVFSYLVGLTNHRESRNASQSLILRLLPGKGRHMSHHTVKVARETP
jgi:hypothetical protein